MCWYADYKLNSEMCVGNDHIIADECIVECINLMHLQSLEHRCKIQRQ